MADERSRLSADTGDVESAELQPTQAGNRYDNREFLCGRDFAKIPTPAVHTYDLAARVEYGPATRATTHADRGLEMWVAHKRMLALGDIAKEPSAVVVGADRDKLRHDR